MEITAGNSSSASSDISDSSSIDSMNVKDANIAQSRSTNTLSVQGRQDSSHHQRQQRRHSFAGRGDLLAIRKSDTTAPLCNCNSELLEEELRQFRRSSAEAIQNSWNEVETLQKTCMKYDDKIQETRQQIGWKTTQLDDCLTRFDELEQELEDLNDNDASSRTTQQPSEHSTVYDNDHDHDDHEEEQECQVRVSSHVQSRDAEKKRLKEILSSRNSTIDCMEYVLSQNVKMMQKFQLKLQEREEKGSDGFTWESSRGFNDS